MNLLNKNKTNKEDNNSQSKYIQLLKRSTAPASEHDSLLSQAKVVIEELEAIGQPIDEIEIIDEVLKQNDYEFLNSKPEQGIEKSLKIRHSARELTITDEPISHLNLDVKLGALVIDLREFEMNGGDLLLNVNSSYSALEIYLNDNVAVSDWIENKHSSVSYSYLGTNYDNFKKVNIENTAHTITLEGKIKGSSIVFKYNEQGAIINQHLGGHHGRAFHHNTKESLEQKLELELEKLDAKAMRRRERLKNRIERKIEKIDKYN